jgi:hypothetical protein
MVTNHSMDSELTRHALYRGVYSRVAKQLGLDRSYVSRVANGERRSKKVEAALLAEIKRIEKIAGKRSTKAKGASA